jgi:hypothetical protein
MESFTLFDNLRKSKELIARYADLDFEIWSLKFYIQQYDRKTLFTFLSLVPTLILIYAPRITINFRTNMFTFLAVAIISFFVLKYGVFKLVIRLKRQSLWHSNQTKLLNLLDEMNKLVQQLDDFTVLPPKYRTMHAVDAIEDYILNKRIDTLKEGLNLYEDELYKMQQMHHQQFQIEQNYQMMHQNSQMIKQNKKMIRAQTVTNTLLMFS